MAGVKIRATVSGLDQVLRAVEELVSKDIPVAVRRGVDNAGKLVQAEAKAILKSHNSVVTGALAKAIGRRMKTYGRGRVAVAIIGARKDAPADAEKPSKRKKPFALTLKTEKGVRRVVPANYVHLVEFGTRPHSVAKGSKLVRKGKGGRAVGQSSGAFHPGAKPHPFLRPALDRVKPQVLTAVVTQARRAIEKLKAKG